MAHHGVRPQARRSGTTTTQPGASDSASTPSPLIEGFGAIVAALDVGIAIVADLTGDWFADGRFPNIPKSVLVERADSPNDPAPSSAPLSPGGSATPTPWPYTPADLEEAFVAHELAQLSYGRPAMLLGEAADIIDEGGYF